MIQLCVHTEKLLFQKSNVYSTELKNNIINDAVRSSVTHKISYKQNKAIFLAIELLIEMINTTHNTIFSVIPNDIDIIKYNEKDFFARHTDFVPIKNKYVTYYTLLFCIGANCTGREKTLYVNNDKLKFSDPITPNDWIIFKNEIDHEGLLVESGYKIVLRANLIHVNY